MGLLVALLIVLDTSCCKRSFALINRMHTRLRSRLGVAILNNNHVLVALLWVPSL
jgi:hypothetical protein